ncbi:MAG: HAD family hydrolase [Promethearchaeota archaeon]
MNIKGIIFDFGFTLFNFRNVSMETYMDAYKRGLQKSIAILKKQDIFKDQENIDNFKKLFKRKRASFFQKSLKTKEEFPTTLIFKKVLDLMAKKELILDLDDKGDDFYFELANLYHSGEAEEWIPFEFTKKTLDKLYNLREIKLGVLSNHPPHPLIENLLKKYDLYYYFDAVVTSALYGKRKPDPGIFHYTLKKMGLEGSGDSCIMCGDEPADIVGGHRAGVQTILCERIYKFPIEREINVPNVIEIKDISEIFDHIA